MSDAILDASALLVLLNAEPGRDRVAEELAGATISAVNLAEVVGKLVDGGVPEPAARDAVLGLGLDIRAFDAEAACRTGALRGATRDTGLSLGDRACLALAQQLGRPVLTADRSWSKLKVGVTVRLVR